MALMGSIARSFSSSDLESAERIHEYVLNQERGIGDAIPNLSKDVTRSTMVMPMTNGLPSNRSRELLYEAVVDIGTLQELEMEKSINWFSLGRNLLPLRTDSDGNGLCHAISLYIWGVHDRQLTLRRFLKRRLLRECLKPGRLFERWQRAEVLTLNSVPQENADYRRDWTTIVEMSSASKLVGRPGPLYCPLESIHIFTLCNILARPIIVLSDSVFRNDTSGSVQPSKIGGVYLPVLRHETECEKSPIVIAYERGHYRPLISSENLEIEVCCTKVSIDAQHCIPLTRHSLEPLPTHFLTDEEEMNIDQLKDTYLELSSLPLNSEDFNVAIQGQKSIVCAMLSFRAPPAWTIQLMQSLYFSIQELGESRHMDIKPADPAIALRKVCNSHVRGCTNFGEERFGGYCPSCYNFLLMQLQKPSEASENQGHRAKTTMQVSMTNCSTEASSKVHNIPQQIEAGGSRNFTASCVKVGCLRQGNSKLYGLCYECYTMKITGELSPLQAPIFPNTQEGLLTSNTFGRGHPASYSSSANVSVSAGMKNPSVSDLDRHQVAQSCIDLPESSPMIPSSTYQLNTSSNSFSRSHGMHVRMGNSPEELQRQYKTSGTSGGAERTSSGGDRHEKHSNIMKCNMDGCSNDGFDNDFGLCKTCLKEQIQHQCKQAEKYHVTRKASSDTFVSSPNSSCFKPPVVYSGFSGPMSGITSYVRKHTNEGQASSSLPLFDSKEVLKCCVPKCENPSEPENNGFCTSCYRAVAFVSSQFQAQKCSTPTCKNFANGQLGTLCLECYRRVNERQSTSSYGFQSGISPPHQNSSEEKPRYSLPDTVGTATVAKTCVLEKCDGTGDPANAGLCQSCFEATLKLEENLTSKRTNEYKGGSKASQKAYIFIPCNTVGCRGLGVAGQDMFCDHCYAKRKGGNDSLARSSGPTQCKAANCSYFGTQEFGGFCSRCFYERTKEDTDASGTRRRQMGSRGQVSTLVPPLAADESYGIDTKRPLAQGSSDLCRQPDCNMSGDPNKDGFCSRCSLTESFSDDFVLVGNRSLVRK